MMKTFAITQYRQPLQCVEIDIPQPTGTEVLLKVRACGVCHTDLHIWEGGYDMGGGKTMKMSDRGQTLPHVMGHETVGTVVGLGAAAAGLELGETKLVYPWIGCGRCAICEADNDHLCANPQYIGVVRPGGYADYILVKHPRYLIDIGSLAPEQAAPYACAGLTAYSALKKLGPGCFNLPILIVGAGGLGLMCLHLLRAVGGKDAIVMDTDAFKRQAALKAGAIAAIDPSASDVGEQLATVTGGSLWSIIDFVGSAATWALAMANVSKGGTYVVVGLFGGETTVSLPMFPLRSVTVTGSFVGSRTELIQLMAIVDSGKVSSVPIVVRPMDNVGDTLMDLKNAHIAGRAVLVNSG